MRKLVLPINAPVSSLRLRPAILDERVDHNGRDDYNSTENCPLRRPLTDEEEDPDRIQQRFDETDDACVEWTCAAGYAFDKEHVRDPDLNDAEK